MMAPYLLHFEIMRSAKSRGCLCYDFFGVTPQDAPPDAWTEISVFKRKFGGREVRLVPTLEYVYDAAAYEAWEAYERERRRKRRARRDAAEEAAHSSLAG
jgi:lipid II:glycine glycyltransferase (peptidoglycan interpeptide bridge formation enzyme)